MGLGYKNNINAAVTAVSNTFIDEYMGTASGEYVKVYLYLLRHAGESVEIPDIAESFSEYEKCTAMLAGLLHDIGHGPFSHAFESVSSCRHETFTQRILLEDALPLLRPGIVGIGATVSPGNPYSLNNAKASGFEIVSRREMYGGHDRYLLAKHL